MSNSYYNKTGSPAQDSFQSSSVIRSEYAALEAGFDKLPVLSGNAGKVIVVNSSSNALIPTSGPIDLTTPAPGTNNTNIATTAFVREIVFWLPATAKNLLINGDFSIDQRNEGAAVTPTATQYLADEWQFVSTVASKLTFQRLSTDTPPKSRTYMQISVAAQYAPAAGDTFVLWQKIEGTVAAQLMFGLSSGKSVTLSLDVKGSVAGTYGVSLRNSAGTQSNVGQITVTTSWATQSVTFTPSTTGTWLTDINIGLILAFDVGSGTSFNSTAAGTWESSSHYRQSSNVTFVNQANGSTLKLSNVQLQEGTIATAFEELHISEKYRRCMRRYEKSFDIGLATAQNVGTGTGDMRWTHVTGGTTSRQIVYFKENKPSSSVLVTYYNPLAANALAWNHTTATSVTTTSTFNLSESAFSVSVTHTAGSAGDTMSFHWVAKEEL